MQSPIRAITLDLDDTLWPFAPIGARIEQAQHAWLLANCPQTAQQFPPAGMRLLREAINSERPELAHDFSTLRRLTLARALELAGDDPEHAHAGFEAFQVERNRVECYPDAIPALQRLASRLPLAALTNGNADLARIGLDAHFRFTLGAGEHGRAKPSPCIFLAACARFPLSPGEVLHVGDDVELDVAGAHAAGMRTCWINRRAADAPPTPWPRRDFVPDLEFDSLAGLADWVDTACSFPTARTFAA